jgi:hypothetical protein
MKPSKKFKKQITPKLIFQNKIIQRQDAKPKKVLR